MLRLQAVIAVALAARSTNAAAQVAAALQMRAQAHSETGNLLTASEDYRRRRPMSIGKSSSSTKC